MQKSWSRSRRMLGWMTLALSWIQLSSEKRNNEPVQAWERERKPYLMAWVLSYGGWQSLDVGYQGLATESARGLVS